MEKHYVLKLETIFAIILHMSELRPDHKRLAVCSESPGQITAKLGRDRTQERICSQRFQVQIPFIAVN